MEDSTDLRILGSTIAFPDNHSSQSSLPITTLALQNGPSNVVSNVVLDESLQYKNRLQTLAARSDIALPMYQTVNEGLHHDPKFRTMVIFDGKIYISSNTFHKKKASEQDAARIALEAQPPEDKDDTPSPEVNDVVENFLVSKSILNEYAAKLKVAKPKYDTVKHGGGLSPVFVSTVVFEGTRYTGAAGRNKKDAERLAARAAITSILGNSTSGPLYEVIKAKSTVYGAVGDPDGAQQKDAGTAIPNGGEQVAGSAAADTNETGMTLAVMPSTMFSMWPKPSGGEDSGSKKRRRTQKKSD